MVRARKPSAEEREALAQIDRIRSKMADRFREQRELEDAFAEAAAAARHYRMVSDPEHGGSYRQFLENIGALKKRR